VTTTGKKSKGFKRYSKTILDIVKERIRSTSEEDSEGLSKCYDNLLFDKKGPTRLEKELSEDEKFSSTILNGFFEINSSYESLRDFEIYVGRFPFSGTSITKARYLSHIIESYMNEVYLFQERLEKLLKELKKSYRSDRRRLVIEKLVKELLKFVLESLKPLVRIRARHVHEKRYTDRGIDKLSLLELIAPSDPAFAVLYELEYKNIRKQWKDTISKNNKAVEEILDKYFDDLFDVVFKKNGELIYPQS